MTLPTTLEVTGRGTLEARLVIEGLPVEFVTHPAMERTTTDGRERIIGLQRQGLTIGEKVQIKAGKFRSHEMTATIVDRMGDDKITDALVKTPTRVTFLDEDLTDTESSIDVLSTDGIQSGDIVHIGTEAIEVGGVSGNTLTGCSRAMWDTTAQYHYAADGNVLGRPAVYLDRPRSLERRRAVLWLYGPGDDLQGNGWARWRGVCKTDARLMKSLSSWSIQLAGLDDLFNQTMGRELENELQPRGIYYHWGAPIVLWGYDNGEARRALFSGFWESNAELVDDLNAEIATWDFTGVYSGWVLRAELDDDGGYFFSLRTGDSGGLFLFQLTGVVEGRIAEARKVSDGSFVGDSGTGVVTNLEANTDYRIVAVGADDVPGFRQVPRGVFDGFEATSGSRDSANTSASTQVLYLSGETALPSRISAIEYAPADGDAQALRVIEIDASDRRVRAKGVQPVEGRAFWPGALPTIRLAREYAQGSLADLFSALTSDGPEYANIGGSPLITTFDIDQSEIDDVVAEAVAGQAWASNRSFVTGSGVNLWDLIAQECLLIGVYPYVTLTGQLSLRRLEVPSAVEPGATAIGAEAALIINARWPTWERNAQGSLNTITVKTGYDPVEEEHVGRDITVVDRSALAEAKGQRDIEIAPFSYTNETSLPYEQISESLRPLLGLYSGAHATLALEVPWSHFGTLCGGKTATTLAQVPDPATGRRGITGQPGFVIERRFDLDRGKGRLTLFVMLDRLAGYAPSAYVTGQSNTSGNDWTLTVSDTWLGSLPLYRDGEGPSDHFAGGDQVRVIEIDPVSGGVTHVAGVVTGTPSDTTISVVLDSTWTPGSDLWMLESDEASDPVQGSQEDYLYLATTEALINFSTAADAKVFGP